MKETIGEKIKRLRKKKGFTQSNIHHNQSQVALIEKGAKKGGISNPEENTLRVIAKKMDMTFDELITDTTWEKPESATIGKEFAFSPTAFNIEIDDHLNIEWSHRSFPLVNDNDEKNEYCPYSGHSLISKCEKCNRKIEKSDQQYCFGCGQRLFEDIFIYEDIISMCSDLTVRTNHEEYADAFQDLNYILGDNKNLYGLVLNFEKCDSPKLLLEEIEARRKKGVVSLAHSNDYIKMRKMIFAYAKKDLRPPIGMYSIIELNNQICLALIQTLKKVMKGLTPTAGLTVDETKARLFQRVAGIIDDFLTNQPLPAATGMALGLFHSLRKGIDDDDEIMSKMESILNDSKENSEDGNSETAAENETEQESNNAENNDDKESKND